MIIISQNLVLAAEEQNSPVFGWHNLVAIGTVTSTSSDTSYPITNVANPATNLFWKAAATGTITIDVDTTAYADVVDYLGIARHNFGTTRATVRLDVQNIDNSFSTLIPAFTPADDTPLLLRFQPQLAKKIRLIITTTTVAVPSIAVLYGGKLLVSQRRVYVGHTPITMGRSASVTSGRSESGNFLGRIITKQVVSGGVKLQNLTPSWYREKFDPFVKSAVGSPFFFAWRPTSYPAEVGYVWMTSDPMPVNARSNGMMEVELQFTGIIA